MTRIDPTLVETSPLTALLGHPSSGLVPGSAPVRLARKHRVSTTVLGSRRDRHSTVADGATVGGVTSFRPPATSNSLAGQVGAFLVQFVLLGLSGLWLVRRHPALLENIGHSITHQPLVNGVTGALAATTLLVLFVYMAFTLILIPLSIVGLVGELLVVLYGQVVFGHLIGKRLPVDRAEVATVLGIGLLLLLVEILGELPFLGVLVQLGLITVGFGAVVNTYFGLKRFEPTMIPGNRE
ncbi:MAG: hypothetical protein V5A25_09600 [Halovenus sp.]